MTTESTQPRSLLWTTAVRGVVVLTLTLLGAGVVACGDDGVEDVISFVEYVGATGEVLDANGIEPESDVYCEGSTETNEVTCTGMTTEAQSIEATGEDLGEDTATLVVTVDGEVLYDGLLDDAGDQ